MGLTFGNLGHCLGLVKHAHGEATSAIRIITPASIWPSSYNVAYHNPLISFRELQSDFVAFVSS